MLLERIEERRLVEQKHIHGVTFGIIGDAKGRRSGEYGGRVEIAIIDPCDPTGSIMRIGMITDEVVHLSA